MKAPYERFFELVCAAAGLLLLLPVLTVIAAVVLWDDGHPIFFRQTRVGRDGKPFQIWKFRTMHTGAPGSPVTAAGDSRVTRSGASLRKYKLDELPQLWNVLRGNMSLVGPRPEVPEYVQLAAPRWQAVLRVRPGITDLASLLLRDEEKLLGAVLNPNAFYRDTILPQKLLLNLTYLRSRSFGRDLKLIFLSIRYSLFPAGFDAARIHRLLSPADAGSLSGWLEYAYRARPAGLPESWLVPAEPGQGAAAQGAGDE
jgi:lipopolysaccharide/colanic/teichoic acid biosynthesis glycosyltransferase